MDTQSLLKANGILLPHLELYGHINPSGMSLHLTELQGIKTKDYPLFLKCYK